MKKLIALLTAAIMIISFAACSNSNKNSSSSKADETTAAPTEAETTTAASAVVDTSSWNWVDAELDCYGYKVNGELCYLSYKYPDNFTASQSNESGLQYRSYNFSPADSKVKPNESPYGIYITFGQGSFGGATKEMLEADAAGGLTERELGGRKVLFGTMPPDPNTGAKTFAYYLPFDDKEYARISIVLTDPEPNSAFRKTFEESLSFTKS